MCNFEYILKYFNIHSIDLIKCMYIKMPNIESKYYNNCNYEEKFDYCINMKLPFIIDFILKGEDFYLTNCNGIIIKDVYILYNLDDSIFIYETIDNIFHDLSLLDEYNRSLINYYNLMKII